MNKKRAVLSLIVIVLMGSQWLMPSHFWMIGARPAPAHAGHSTHDYSSSTVMPLQRPCCEQNDGAPNFHGDLCCGTVPALPSAISDLSSYTPYLSLTAVEPHEKIFVFLPPLWHPPTL